MCGIFATTRLDLWRDRLDAIRAGLRHRGPDGDGWHIDEEAGVMLVHSRLAVVGLGPVGRQPDQRDGSVLVYNGEVYNHAVVARELGMRTPPCDTHTVHESLIREGASGLSRLDGMFALARWDSRSRELTIARDPWGIKPLYVLQHDDGGISIASTIAVLALVRPRVDRYGLAQFLAFGHTTPTASVYEKLRKLPPGTYLSAKGTSRAWRLRGGMVRQRSDAEHAGLGDAIERSVRNQLMADVPVGVFLSGGVDSTLVAAEVARAGATVRTFTLAFPESPSIDESERAAQNARSLGLASTLVPVTSKRLVGGAEGLVATCGEPIGDAAVLAVEMLAERAAQDVKVVLTGEGADEVFGGYARYRIIQRLQRRSVRLASRPLRSVAPLLARYRTDQPWQRAASAVAHGGGALGYASMLQAELSSFSSCPDLLETMKAELRTDWELGLRSSGTASAGLGFDQRRWLPNTYLEKIDRATMRHSLEGRVPFLGCEPVTWAARHQPNGKEAILHALQSISPDVDLPGRKVGLAIDVPALMRAGLDRDLSRVLCSSDSVVAKSFGASTVAQLRERSHRSATLAFRLAMVGVWENVMDPTA